MKIGIVTQDFDLISGQGRYAVELARRLRERCDLHIFANTLDAPGVTGITLHHVPANRQRFLFTIPTFLVAAEWQVRRARLDLIHAQGLSCWSADVVTVHMCNAARARALPTDAFKSRLFASLLTPLERAFYRQRRLRHAITMSRRLAGEIQREYGWNKPFTVIPHGTNTGEFRPPQNPAEREAMRQYFRLPAAGWHWLFVGEAVKGLRPTIEALPRFPQAHLLVVSRSHLEPYETLANKLGVRNRITFHGFEPQPNLAFRAADVLVYPSEYEAFGMVVTEAMASGLPVVSGKNIGAAELVTDGVNGLLINPRDPEDLHSKLAWLESSPEASRHLGAAGRETILRHSWDVCADQTWQVYTSVWSAQQRDS